MTQYPQQPGYPPGGGPPAAGGTLPNYMVQSILVTIFCCLPLGIAAIVFAAQVNSKLAAGDYAGAVEASKKAKQFSTWAVIAWAILVVISIILQIAGVALFHFGAQR
jgi:hypothetical protein